MTEPSTLKEGSMGIYPFDANDVYANVNNKYELVEWRKLPHSLQNRIYEDIVFYHQPRAHYNSQSQSRKIWSKNMVVQRAKN